MQTIKVYWRTDVYIHSFSKQFFLTNSFVLSNFNGNDMIIVSNELEGNGKVVIVVRF